MADHDSCPDDEFPEPMTSGPVSSRYSVLVKTGAIGWDSAQVRLLAEMDALVLALEGRKNGAPNRFMQFFGRREPAALKGLYIWGSVGRGKTMLMDLMFDALPGKSKRRVHFHAFMADVHERIYKWRQLLKEGAVKGDNPIAPVAQALALEASVLCFDEFAVTDIADAMILGRLFTALFQHGVIVIATSNVAPERLYENGLNRALFLPFINLLDERMTVRQLVSRTDFRLEKLDGGSLFHVPDDDAATRSLDLIFRELTGRDRGEAKTLIVKGHPVDVPNASHGVARFEFADLCARPLAASDYLELARNFHTLIIDHIPRMTQAERNEAKRFILLIDTLYDRRVKLVASAAVEVHELYSAEQGVEAFEFDRTVSRLIEMRSEEYFSQPHDAAEHATGVSTGLVET